MEDEDRINWDKAWSSMPNRRILDIDHFDFAKSLGLNVGRLLSVTIAEAPDAYSDQLYIATRDCPICGETTDGDGDKLVTSVNPAFTSIPNLAFGAFAHRDCFDNCPLIKGPAPIPW